MRLLPRDEKFFDLFTSVAELSVGAAKLQLDLLRADDTIEERSSTRSSGWNTKPIRSLMR